MSPLAKLGPHIILPSEGALTWANVAPIIKTIDNVQVLASAPAGVITILRHCFGGNCRDQPLNSPGAAVQTLLDGLFGFRPSYVELYNEVEIDNPQLDLAAYVAWVRQATELLHWAGARVAGFSFMPGYPGYDGWLYLASQGFGGVDALSIHEYWGSANLDTPSVLYHRLIHEWTGGNHPPIIITECGRGGGWKTAGLSPQQYADELLRYDQLLMADSYVPGATVFTAGPTYDWYDYSTDQLLSYLGIQAPQAAPPSPGGGGTGGTPISNPASPSGTLPLSLIVLGGLALAVFGYGVYSLATSKGEA